MLIILRHFLSFCSCTTLKIFRNRVYVYTLILFLAYLLRKKVCIHSQNVNNKYCIVITLGKHKFAASRAGLHNSESSKSQIDQHKLVAGRKSLFCHRVEENLKGQVIIRSQAFATFFATEFSRAARKDLAGHMRPACCAGSRVCLVTEITYYVHVLALCSPGVTLD